ncbi:acetyl-CoA carboxylase biotin carboxyl carrier protein [Fulvivirga sp. M361]|uniref:acetyl-CoA carboxylase biotin carboxyl carrier protein n=1 Tax=Fulvivirga sp. M361 TaxID=2594266 RepID=UPI0011799B01|nr:acetyl-CoA carboxylase biotin carboxyl carrier protein [Fulvivirga sp. M361]TRX61774.1 acetyl-CoA carboxylase biotin carboxyl carrier protein [Fulvivirga sp. M361]
MKSKEIRDLIDFISQTGLNEVNIETEEIKLSIKRAPDVKTKIVESGVSAIPVAAAAAPPPAPAPAETIAPAAPKAATTQSTEDSSQYIEVKSPMIGTFYRSANPDSPSFVSVGDKIEVGQTLCIVEAMKLFNEIESEVSGTIVKAMVENSSPVEYDQVLFLVDPS